MQDLTLVGLNEDGTRLLLVSASGEEFSVPVDTRLRAALGQDTAQKKTQKKTGRGDNARLGQLETKMDSALRPRDIQMRIRAGESPEDVAAAAQTTVDAIMPFAGPVIAEREHVARNALKGSLRRPSGDTTSPRTLGEAAELYFAEHSLHDEDVEWDAWRRPDGRWALVATYAVGGRSRTAEFTHDQPGRYVVADNDDAKILTGELRAPGESAPAPQARRLSSVHTQDELPLGDDAIELVRDNRAAAPDEPAPDPDPTADTADADWLAEPVEPSPEDVPLIEDEPAAVDEPGVDEPAAEVDEPEPAAAADEAADDEDEDTVEVKQASSKRKGRSSVPSWDEIMFGGSAKED
jgi:hypothetical protein